MSNFTRMILYAGLTMVGIQHAAAQTYEVFSGYSFTKMRPTRTLDHFTMNGWNTSFTAYPTRRFGVTADFAGFYGSIEQGAAGTVYGGTTLRQYSFMAGPQVRLFRTSRFETSAKAVFGASHGYVPDQVLSNGITVANASENAFSSLFGSNFDYHVSKRFSIRFSPGMYIGQFGVDQTQKNFRFSVGPVFHFGGVE